MADTRIAVIVPAYNAEAFVADALRSVLAQTRMPDEIVVVDDASADRTAEVAATLDPGIRVIRLEENRGGGTARNVGAEATEAELIAFLDADDLWEAEHLANLEAALHAYPETVVAFCRGQQFGIEHWTQAARLPMGEPADAFWECTRENVVFPPSALIRRADFEAVGGFQPDLPCCQDFEFFRRLATRGPFLCVPEITMWYRKHGNQVTRSILRNRRVQYEIRKRWFEEAKETATAEELARHEEVLRDAWDTHLSIAWNKRDWPLFRQYLDLGDWIPGGAPIRARWAPRLLAVPFMGILDRIRGVGPPASEPPTDLRGPPTFEPAPPQGGG